MLIFQIALLSACSTSPTIEAASKERDLAPPLELNFLLRAAACQRAGSYEQLFSEKATQRCAEGFSAVELAAVANRSSVVEALHAWNPETLATGPSGLNALHLAALHRSREALESFARLRPGEFDVANPSGRTPLHFAAISGDELAFARAIELAADPLRPDAAGISAAQYLLRSRTPLDAARATVVLDDATVARIREWDGAPPRFALWRTNSYGSPIQLEWAIWSDGTILVDVSRGFGAVALLVGSAATSELEILAADLRATGLETILGKCVIAMHGRGRRIDVWTGERLESASCSAANSYRWLPECSDPERAWFCSVWTSSAQLLAAPVPTTLGQFPHDPQRPSFRAYRPDIPAETPWSSAP